MKYQVQVVPNSVRSTNRCVASLGGIERAETFTVGNLKKRTISTRSDLVNKVTTKHQLANALFVSDFKNYPRTQILI